MFLWELKIKMIQERNKENGRENTKQQEKLKQRSDKPISLKNSK